MTDLLDELQNEATIRDEENGWTRETVTTLPEWRDPELLKPFAKAYLSEKSVTIRDTKVRKIVGPKIPNGAIARLYLQSILRHAKEEAPKSMLARRVPFQRDAHQFDERRPAYFFRGQTGGPFVLVDITACYASIYSRLSVDMTYRPDTDPPLFGIGRGAFPRKDEWIETKGPRNALFGSIVNPTVREWRHGEPVDNAFPNRFYAPDLKGVIFDVCHAIALEAREEFGCLSWAVDGGIFRPEEGRTFVEWLESAFGLNATVRAEGLGWMFGPTSYSIGEVTTADVEKGQAHEWPETDNLRETSKRSRGWLADVLRDVA
jgi:hypothetical protein